MVYFAVIAISFLTGFLILFLAKKYSVVMDCEKSIKPQKFHYSATPRIGGLCIFIGSLFMLLDPVGRMIILSSLPVFLIGFYEDLTEAVSPKKRLFFMALGGLIALSTLDVLISDISFIHMPHYAAVAFTLFALVGVTNSINIIDGLNGLASGTSIIALFALLFAAHLVGDFQLSKLIVISMFAVCGFFVWVYPMGKIFMGDGGAYFMGFILAVFSTLIVNRNADVSVWFPLAVLIFPIWEVAFSIYRRKFIRKQDALSPDRLHLHSLLYKRTKFSNPVAAGILLLIYAAFQAFTIYFYDSSVILVAMIIGFIVVYHVFYRSLVQFKFGIGKN